MSKPSSTNSPRLSISERKDWYISRVSRDTDIAKVTDRVALSKSNILKGIKVVIALGIHLFPFRTEKLSPTTSMVLRKSGRVDSRRFRVQTPNKWKESIERLVPFCVYSWWLWLSINTLFVFGLYLFCGLCSICLWNNSTNPVFNKEVVLFGCLFIWLVFRDIAFFNKLYWTMVRLFHSYNIEIEQ